MSQGCKHLSTFDAAHLGMVFSSGPKEMQLESRCLYLQRRVPAVVLRVYA